MTNETVEEAVAPQDGMTVAEVAKDAKKSEATVHRWIARKENPLPSYKHFGSRMVRRSAYRSWLNLDEESGES